MSHPSMSPVSTVIRNASWFITGRAPGRPRQTGQVCVFGSAPNSTGEAQNILERVLSWTCTSKPMVAMCFIAPSIIAEALKRVPLFCHVERSETSSYFKPVRFSIMCASAYTFSSFRNQACTGSSWILRFAQNDKGCCCFKPSTLGCIRLQRVIECALNIEFFDAIHEHRIVYCFDDAGILKKFEEAPLLNHVGDFWIASQCDDLWMLGQLARAGKRQKFLRAFRTGNNAARFLQRFVRSV